MSYRLILSATLRNDCCRILQGSPYFKDHTSLRLLFDVAELEQYLHHLPDASNAVERAERCIVFLMSHPVGLEEDPPLITMLKIVQNSPQSHALEQAEFDQIYGKICDELRQQLQEKHNDQERERVSREHGVVNGTVADSATAGAYAWLDLDLLDVTAIGLKVALAVFDGARFSIFEAAAADLTKRLQQLLEPESSNPDTEDATPAARVRKPNLKQRLAEAGAEIDEIRRPFADGEEVAERVVKLRDSTRNAGALHALWMECLEWHEAVVDWLSDYIQGKPADVRLRVAIAAGIIGLADFSEARRLIFLRWARNGDAESRAALGQALGVVCQNPDKRADVFVMLRQWSKSSDRDLRWSVARCLHLVGVYEPRTAIALWKRIADSEAPVIKTVAMKISDNMIHVLEQRYNNPLHTSVYDAILSFFLTVLAEPDLVRPVYEQSIIALQPWVKEELEQRREPGFGTLIFLSLCGILWQSPGADDSLSWPPVLLVLVKEQSAYLEALAGLMWLSWRTTHQQMRRVMTDWLARIELNKPYRRFLLILLQAIIAYDRTQLPERAVRGMIEERVLRFLRDYATRPMQTAPNTVWIYNMLLQTMR